VIVGAGAAVRGWIIPVTNKGPGMSPRPLLTAIAFTKGCPPNHEVLDGVITGIPRQIMLVLVCAFAFLTGPTDKVLDFGGHGQSAHAKRLTARGAPLSSWSRRIRKHVVISLI